MSILEGKTALVAGVANTKSIAWGIAQSLHEHGARVALTCVDSARRRVAKMAAEIDSDLVFSCDVARDDDIQRALREVGAALDGRIDILVHSIAYARLEELGGDFLRTSREGWRVALEISAYSLLAMARAAHPFMKSSSSASITTLTFAGGSRVVPSYNVMGVAKAALECTVRYLAYELGPDGIRVNALSPGPIETMSSMVVERFNEALDRVTRESPMLRCVTPRDVGQAAAFYASDLARMVTGTVLYVDGGADIVSASAGDHPRAGQARPRET